MRRKPIKRVTARILEEIENINEEGFCHESSWYALDRITVIKDICQNLLDGNENACMSGTSFDTKIENFDKEYEIIFFGQEKYDE